MESDTRRDVMFVNKPRLESGREWEIRNNKTNTYLRGKHAVKKIKKEMYLTNTFNSKINIINNYVIRPVQKNLRYGKFCYFFS